MNKRVLVPVVLLLLIAGCTSRTKEIIKEQYVISDIIAERVDSADKKPSRAELEGFVKATKDTFETLKNKGRELSLNVYSRAVTLSDKIVQNEPSVTDEELRQFVKMTRDTYKLMLEEK